MNKSSFTLCIPALNEIEGLKAIMPKIDRAWVDQILILDGGSTDGTIEWCRKSGYEVYVQKQLGLRKAYQEAWPMMSGEFIITFSPDGNSMPEKIPELIAKLKEGYDMVIVSRYLDEAKSEDDDIITGFGNWLFTRLVNVLYCANYTDVMVMFRGYRKQIIYDLKFDGDEGFVIPEKIFNTRISIEPLLSVRVAKNKLRVGEIAGDEPKRIGGVRKLNIIRWGLAYFYQFIAEKFS